MLASHHAPGQVAKGADKFWFRIGDTAPSHYTDGPFDTEEEAYAAAQVRMEEDDCDYGVVGRGEEIDVNPPDGGDVIERLCCSISDNCGSEIGEDYLDRHQVSKEQQQELTDAVEKAVADWLTKHKLWPNFTAIYVTRELTAADRLHAEQEVGKGVPGGD